MRNLVGEGHSPVSPRTEKFVRIPLDSRLAVVAMWIASFALLVLDSLDWQRSLLSTWGLFLALAGTALLKWHLDSYSRRVILEVMSWEHRQLIFDATVAADDDGPSLSVIDGGSG